MQKEILRKENIREDLLKVIEERKNIHWEWRLYYIIPTTIVALAVGFLLAPWWGFAVYLIAAYHIVYLVQELRVNRAHKKKLLTQIERGDISISEEVLSHIAVENVYEPHAGHRRGSHRYNSTKPVSFFYFRSGASWRECSAEKHYTWSKLYDMSPKGLENTSVAGDVFYYVRLQSDGEIGYVYNKKLFEYRES